jgi:hypothetical protein
MKVTMKTLSGWSRLFIVYALLSGLWCFNAGAEAHRQERIAIEQEGRWSFNRIEPGGKLTEPQMKTAAWLREREAGNTGKQVKRYTSEWAVWLLLGAVAIGLVRFVLAGFKPRAV